MIAKKLMENEELVKALDGAENEEEFLRVLTDNGWSEDEIGQLIDLVCSNPGELSEEALEDVAGGCGPVLQRWISKWGYRADTGKWFCKTTYDEDARTITVTNRFGKKESRTYYY